MAAVQKAESKLKPGAGKDQLGSIIKFYGKEGEKNGVKVNFDSKDPGAFGSTSTKNGVTTISFGADAFKGESKSGKGEIVGHEGAHGVDQRADGNPRTFDQFLGTELHAYEAESAVDQGLNKKNSTDGDHPVWFPGISPAENKSNIMINGWDNACYDTAKGPC